MRRLRFPSLFLLTLLLSTRAIFAAPAASVEADPYAWLEAIDSPRAMEWVEARNAESAHALAEGASFQKLQADLLAIYDSDARIPTVAKHGPYYYNFWQDKRHPRGIWRRTTPQEYRKASPRWEVLLDVDALGAAEKVSWVWHGGSLLKSGGYRRALVRLSRGGSDAVAIREFDLTTRRFVPHGFELSESKSEVSWIDPDHIFVATDFGAGSVTTSGYPRIVKRWKRGTPLSSAVTVYAGKPTDVEVSAWHDDTTGFERDLVNRAITFYTSVTFVVDRHGRLHKIDAPLDANLNVFREWLTIELRTPWTAGGKTWPAGALLVTRFEDFMSGKRNLAMVFQPTAHTSLDAHTWTRHHLVLNVLDDVKSSLTVLTPARGGWSRAPFRGAPRFAHTSVDAVDAEESDDYFMNVGDFLIPPTLYGGRIGGEPFKLKSTPAFFDASRLEVTQHFATSRDGTRIPYFQVAARGLTLDGSHPTILNGYGGFEISELPSYSGGMGRAWLTKGGVYVLANIRGGGEYGPKWHEAALKANRPRAYEDFAAVAEDLVARKITSPARLGCVGGSNGGLLMGNMITMYPQDFGAIVCQVPLLDMKRYSHLLAGASWMGEYGDPDKPAEWAYIRTFSPYQNLRDEVRYPPVLFMTSTRDDRVHPSHARKMAARMLAMGSNVLYYENTEGGHGGAADNKQRAHFWALTFTFFDQKLR